MDKLKGITVAETEPKIRNRLTSPNLAGCFSTMSVCNWLYIIALGGLATAASASAESPHQEWPSAQSSVHQSGEWARPPGVTASELIVTGRPVEQSPEEQQAASEREKRSDAREEADLTAQQSMALSAQKLLDLTLWQLIVGCLGLAGLGATLYYSRQATRAAVDAANAARDTVVETRRIGEAQVRAYVSWNGVRIGFGLNDELSVVRCGITASIKNTGQSPANLTGLYSHLAVLRPDETPRVRFTPTGIACTDAIGAGNPFEFADQFLSVADAKAIFLQQHRAYLLGWAAYRDVFSQDSDSDRVLTFCFEVKFRVSPDLWTHDYVKQNSSDGIVLLTSVPIYEIGPDGPYK